LVKLNVGGQRYITTWSTLFSKGDNFFTVLLDNEKGDGVPYVLDEEGYIFIDRDGELFRHVLYYLRTGILSKPDNLPISQLESELDYYQVKRGIQEKNQNTKSNSDTKASGDYETSSKTLKKSAFRTSEGDSWADLLEEGETKKSAFRTSEGDFPSWADLLEGEDESETNEEIWDVRETVMVNGEKVQPKTTFEELSIE